MELKKAMKMEKQILKIFTKIDPYKSTLVCLWVRYELWCKIKIINQAYLADKISFLLLKTDMHPDQFWIDTPKR